MKSEQAAPPTTGEDATVASEPSVAEPAPPAPSGSRTGGFRRAKAVAGSSAGGAAEPVPPTPAAETAPDAAEPGDAVDDPASPVGQAEAHRPVSGHGRLGARLRAVASRAAASSVTARIRAAVAAAISSAAVSGVGRRRRLVPLVIVVAAIAAGVPILLIQNSGQSPTQQQAEAAVPVLAIPDLPDDGVVTPNPAVVSPSGSGGDPQSPLNPASTTARPGSGTVNSTGQPPSKAPTSRPATGAATTPKPVTPAATATAVVEAGPPKTAGPDYDSITGLGCTRDNTTQDYYTRGSGLSGWRTGNSGGFSGFGCQGRYESMPLNGTGSNTDDRYMVWWFATTKVSSANCRLWIHVPATGDGADTSSTAYFAVIPNKDSGSTIGTFTVNESTVRGQWADSGRSWPMRDGKLAVKLTDRGTGRAAASAALVKCYKS